jgi:hypothetical protein
MITTDSTDQQVADFTRKTRQRRVLFAIVAFGAALAAVIGAVSLFGGMGRSAARNRAGLAAGTLRQAFGPHRERCEGLWRPLWTVEWRDISEEKARAFTARLTTEELSCEEVAAIARLLPQRRGAASERLPAPRPPAPPAAPR